MTTATFVRELDNFTGEGRLYRLSEPISYGYDGEGGTTSFVAVSATTVSFFGVETVVFPSDENGEVLSWSKLGVVRAWDHERALASAGLEVV